MSRTDEATPLRLRARDLPTLARIVALWPVAAVLKRSSPLPRLAETFDAAPRGGDTPGGAVDPQRAARLVDGALRRAYRHRPGFCVERSLLLFHLLRRGGHPAHLCFGVAPDDGRLAGHAWVEIDGAPVAERVDPQARYRPTYVYPERT